MSLDPNSVSIIHWFPPKEEHRCGYCKSETGNVCYGMWAETLTVDDYQNLIDRGWRRCGKYCYKPIMNETCCPQYTIRCSALNFKPSKSQKKIIKKFNKYLSDGCLTNERSVELQDEESNEHILIKDKPNNSMDFSQISDNEESKKKTHKLIAKKPEETSSLQPTTQPQAEDKASSNPKTFKKGVGADPTKPPSKKAKLLRLERKQLKMKLKGLDPEINQANEAKSLTQLLNEKSLNAKHKLKLVLIRANQNDETQLERILFTEFELYKKYQICVHNDPPEKCTKKSFSRFLVNTPLKMILVRMSDDNAHYQLTARLYAKYQTIIHCESEDECSEPEFKEFLIKSPLKYVQVSDDGKGFGTFHQQYWLDNQLIAVGVIDILPTCISSVYFFYDPDYRSLTLGTYASLREIEFATNLNKIVPSIEYYYMGYYIHSCQKMRYKGKLCPSYLLCPETYEWFPIERSLIKLDLSKYARLNDDPAAVDTNDCIEDDVNAIKIIINYQFCTYRFYRHRDKHAEIFKNIAKLIGSRCARSMLIVEPQDVHD